MRILVVHNAYRHRGGEDVCVENESTALREAGFDITLCRISSSEATGSLQAALGAPFGLANEGEVERTLERIKPDILHVHNWAPLLSPRLFSRAKQQGIKIIQTLHNFRPLCLNGLFLTPTKKICELCSAGNYWHGILRGCYRQNRIQSLGLAAHLEYSSLSGWYDNVNCFIAPAEFLMNKFVAVGWDRDRFVLQGHFLPEMPKEIPLDPLPYILYLGRLSEEKGVTWLLDLFSASAPPISLHIAGDGPLRELVQSRQNTHIRYLGHIDGELKRNELRFAAALVMPSECYENFPLAIMEANAYGIPALVSDLGGLAEMISTGRNGAAFKRRDGASFWSALENLRRSGHDQRRQTQDYARERFSKESFLSRRRQLYEDLLRSRPVA